MPEKKKFNAITIRIPAEIYDWLEDQAAHEHRSLNAQIGLLLERLYEQAKEQAQRVTPTPP